MIKYDLSFELKKNQRTRGKDLWSMLAVGGGNALSDCDPLFNETRRRGKLSCLLFTVRMTELLMYRPLNAHIAYKQAN